MINSPKDIIAIYYNSWVINDKPSAREQLADDLLFRSPNDSFDSADAFMDACWQFSEFSPKSICFTKSMKKIRPTLYIPWIRFTLANSSKSKMGKFLKSM